MEKKELIKNLYDLRTALLVLGVKCEEVNKKVAFEEMYNNKSKNKNPWNYDDYDFMEYYQLTTSHDSKRNEGLWQSMARTYNLNLNYDVFRALIDFDNHGCNGHRNPIRNWYWDVTNESIFKTNSQWGFSEQWRLYCFNKGVSFDEEEVNKCIGCMANYALNINSLKEKINILKDATTNKKAAFWKGRGRYDLNYGKRVGFFKRKELIKKLNNEDIPALEKALNRQEKKIGSLKTKIRKKYGIADIRTKKQINDDNEVISQVSDACGILVKKYSFISKSDWEDIDALIFFLESGRADTLKEALNLNDMKKYKDEIVASVDRVNKTVIQGINAIRSDLNVYFTTLFNKLDALNDSLITVANEISANTAALHYSSDQICRMIWMATK